MNGIEHPTPQAPPAIVSEASCLSCPTTGLIAGASPEARRSYPDRDEGDDPRDCHWPSVRSAPHASRQGGLLPWHTSNGGRRDDGGHGTGGLMAGSGRGRSTARPTPSGGWGS